ncbi:S9 family peptidase [Acanthopleuribacter pedis]|uniref:S9 family peptidase n=1 Tax=Acanthopleuribacter pedis TaxID=442870 RepID=A0A8J7PZR4_9BACT|nr:S9 family peptidase [Acanthopleuribacter pedis]MBO1317737.1 S9 family peptidase [Acanthopleuribacter pedis]
MYQRLFLLALWATAAAFLTAGADPTLTSPKAPIAKKVPKKLEKHGDVRIDNYYWLNQREDPEVLAYLNQENAYTKSKMAHTEALQEALFEEMKGRIKQDDSSVPVLFQGYYYYSRKEEGKQYDIYCRRKGSMEAAEEVILDVNKLAEGHSFMSVRGLAVSPNNNLLAYGVDTRGRRIYQIRVKDLSTGKHLEETIDAGTANITWANDNKTFFYTKREEGTLRSYQIWRHELGGDKDTLVFHEKDETFNCGTYKSTSGKYVLIHSGQTVEDEVQVIPADKPTEAPRVFLKRERGHEYRVDHLDNHFYVMTNRNALNFKVMKTKDSDWAESSWQQVVAPREDVLIRGLDLFNNHLVLSETDNGISGLSVIDLKSGKRTQIKFDEEVYSIYSLGGMANRDPSNTKLRVSYQSLVTPSQVWDYDMVTGKGTLLKQDEILGGFDPSKYVSERIEVTARDGKKVPVSMVYPKGFKKAAKKPVLLYAYGSYGSSARIGFSSSRLSLLERGFGYAIAHIRGGQDKGRAWYEDGKMMNKKNTFTDFIDCGKHLIDKGYADKDLLFARGGSAGGLLMGAVLNMEPELFRGIHAAVPFVDVITTMLDPSIPLTTGEYDEWGNPNKKAEYQYILSYSPYDNITAANYTNLLVTTGLHDSQVQYWEPAKWVAKMRALKTGDNLLLLDTNMDAGHGGASGRFNRLKEMALITAFFLDLSGIDK